MDGKSKFILGLSLLINVAVLILVGATYYKKQYVSQNNATVAFEQPSNQEASSEENVQPDNFEVANEVKEEVVEENVEQPKEEPAPVETKEEPKGIVLTGKKTSSGVSLSWTASGLKNFEGFKVVKSKDSNPVYPGDDYQYLSDTGTRSYSWKIDSGSKYHFRVCQYSGGKCLLYSNDVYLETPSGDDGEAGEYASSLSLALYEESGHKYLKWSIAGGDAPKGYKVVKSKDKNPEYPEDGYYQYISDEDTKKVKLEGFDGGDKYHFRVCIYKGGSCGAYSNDIEVSF